MLCGMDKGLGEGDTCSGQEQRHVEEARALPSQFLYLGITAVLHHVSDVVCQWCGVAQDS